MKKILRIALIAACWMLSANAAGAGWQWQQNYYKEYGHLHWPGLVVSQDYKLQASFHEELKMTPESFNKDIYDWNFAAIYYDKKDRFRNEHWRMRQYKTVYSKQVQQGVYLDALYGHNKSDSADFYSYHERDDRILCVGLRFDC